MYVYIYLGNGVKRAKVTCPGHRENDHPTKPGSVPAAKPAPCVPAGLSPPLCRTVALTSNFLESPPGLKTERAPVKFRSLMGGTQQI